MKKSAIGHPLLTVGLIVSLLSLSPGDSPGQTNRFTLPSQLEGLAIVGDPGSEIQVSGRVELTPDRSQGVLHVTAKLGSDWHIYSVTQQKGGPLRTQVVLEPSSDYTLAGPFQPDKPPKVRRLEFFDVPVEEHHEQVTWTAPIRVNAGAAETLRISGKLDGQICQEKGGCVPLKTMDTSFAANVTGTIARMPVQQASDLTKRRTPPVSSTQLAAAPAGSVIPPDLNLALAPADGYRGGTIHTVIQGHVEPAGTLAGGQFDLVLTAIPDAGWHVYAYAEKDPDAISKPMLIAVVEPADWRVGRAVASDDPVVKQTGLSLEPEQRYHEKAVTWRIPITVPAGSASQRQTIKGMIGYQTCSASRCDMPVGAYFAATVDVGKDVPGPVPLQFASGRYSTVAKYLNGNPVAGTSDAGSPATANRTGTGGFDPSRIEIMQTDHQSVAYILLFAFVGGFLLNFMPCVLPVIGLKIMSFVQQSGERRSRIFTLNLWYSLGMLSIFWLLATLASAASLGLSNESLGWGEQFNYDGFTIPLLSVVFVMALSFIGVWEIPIPGFVGTGRANDLAQREGLVGAFSKGVLTTILATPCSGPGLATALTWSATKPPSVVYLVFTAMGLGMAFPYLLIGAFPRLVRFIPKPGAWMNTFKELMGFILLGTVVYMFSLIDSEHVVPTLAVIFALWAACWLVGRIPITATTGTKFASWVTAIGFAFAVTWFAFVYEADEANELPWQTFSLAAMDEYVRADQTVLVDFTAGWCPTCKALEWSVLNTKPVQELVAKNDVVTLVADWSEENEEIEAMLEALGSKQLPVIAVFPAGDAYRPSRLTGLYTRGELLRNLQAAGPSRSTRLASDAH